MIQVTKAVVKNTEYRMTVNGIRDFILVLFVSTREEIKPYKIGAGM